MNVKVIRTEADYEVALARIEKLMDAALGTPKGDELDVLSLLVETYEKEHYPIGSPTPLEAIEFFMDQKGLTNADMGEYLGSPSKVSEVLNGIRPLSKTMIRNLVEGLGIPAEILLEVQGSTFTTGGIFTSPEYKYTTKAYGVTGLGKIAAEACLSSYKYCSPEECLLAA